MVVRAGVVLIGGVMIKCCFSLASPLCWIMFVLRVDRETAPAVATAAIVANSG